MALYTIGDLHLSLGSNKPMDIFGERWQNYVEKLRQGFSTLTENDTTVLCGDLSWGKALPDTVHIVVPAVTENIHGFVRVQRQMQVAHCV